MYFRSHPRYEIECAMVDATRTKQPYKNSIKRKKNWDKITPISKPKIQDTTDSRIRKLEYRVFWMERKLKKKIKDLESRL